ncbi:hypothetical protein GR212_15555 [Rhizobium lusitanum]|uniref:Uncharacterized protein n=1 Tax=Rhizobium lusitanum TaxID=293958 RepID=A0A6L9U6T6_9HYPH|nr:hypothetical protein [Rhizobium lusitanum]NEI70994.1 hypothetical protein [Rhizobium lusitanum]
MGDRSIVIALETDAMSRKPSSRTARRAAAKRAAIIQSACVCVMLVSGALVALTLTFAYGTMI